MSKKTTINTFFADSRLRFWELHHRMKIGNYKVVDEKRDLLKTLSTHPTSSIYPLITHRKDKP